MTYFIVVLKDRVTGKYLYKSIGAGNAEQAGMVAVAVAQMEGKSVELIEVKA